jgi:hypothetical protein
VPTERRILQASPRWLVALGALLCGLAASAAMALLAPDKAHAVANDVPETDGNCPLPYYNSFRLDAGFTRVGLPLANSSMQIDATNARILASRTTGAKPCDNLLFQIPKFQWSVQEAPPGQNPTLSNENTLSPTVNLAGPGRYVIRFVACQGKCTLKRNGKSKSVGPFTRDVTINAGTDAAPPPESTPVAPPLNLPNPAPPKFGLAERTAKCSAGGGLTDPEWVTTQRFGGAGDYRLLEGPTSWSRLADLDNFLNHTSQDFEWKVIPDPPYEGLQQPEKSAQGWKTEWETGSLPAIFRPTPGDRNNFGTRPGDRVSTYGFWIFDCGHYPWKTEIHPPVATAVQRPRPVQIPSSFRPAGYPNGFGSNIWVPGVVADLWVNRNSGGAGSCLRSTSLHQPFPNEPGPLFCLKSPHPVNRKFTFNVYLPRSPQQRAQELGRNPPPPPLFVGTEKLSSGTGGAEPTYVVRERNGLTWLEVTVDGSTFNANTYARRMSIAWAYPSPDNWGASRWRVTLTSMNVSDDSEPPFDDGDWRVHFNTNNRDQEWTPLFSCGGCIDDDTTYKLTTSPGGPNVRTGASGGGNGSRPNRSRNLGPDLVLFPDQEVRVHTTGYDDEVLGDDIGTVLDYDPQVAKDDYSTPSSGDEGSYRLNYKIGPVGSVGQATLTPEAAALLRAYSGSTGARCGAVILQEGPRPPRECAPAGKDPTFGSKRVLRLKSLDAFEAQGDEPSEFSLTHISASRFRREYKSLRSRDRRNLLNEINKGLRNVPPALRGDYNELFVTLDKALPSRLVRRAVPRSVRRSVKRYRNRARALRRKRARQRARRRARSRRGIAAAHAAPGRPVVRLTLGELVPPH